LHDPVSDVTEQGVSWELFTLLQLQALVAAEQVAKVCTAGPGVPGVPGVPMSPFSPFSPFNSFFVLTVPSGNFIPPLVISITPLTVSKLPGEDVPIPTLPSELMVNLVLRSAGLLEPFVLRRKDPSESEPVLSKVIAPPGDLSGFWLSSIRKPSPTSLLVSSPRLWINTPKFSKVELSEAVLGDETERGASGLGFPMPTRLSRSLLKL
jgi:hypothetical protein